MDPTTDLVITGLGIPPYSARGLTQTLEPIDEGAIFRRTVNGDLINVGIITGFQKYRTVIQCRDQQAPAFGGLWKGALITIQSIVYLATGTAGGTERTAVAGSTYEESGFTFYRPVLECAVTGFSVDRDEYGAISGWTLEAEEV
jgi:hypothetical protein